jgi:hypothetical protein
MDPHPGRSRDLTRLRLSRHTGFAIVATARALARAQRSFSAHETRVQ